MLPSSSSFGASGSQAAPNLPVSAANLTASAVHGSFDPAASAPADRADHLAMDTAPAGVHAQFAARLPFASLPPLAFSLPPPVPASRIHADAIEDLLVDGDDDDSLPISKWFAQPRHPIAASVPQLQDPLEDAAGRVPTSGTLHSIMQPAIAAAGSQSRSALSRPLQGDVKWRHRDAFTAAADSEPLTLAELLDSTPQRLHAPNTLAPLRSGPSMRTIAPSTQSLSGQRAIPLHVSSTAEQVARASWLQHAVPLMLGAQYGLSSPSRIARLVQVSAARYCSCHID